MVMVDYMEETMKTKDYMLALEEERRKIQVFERELPLCLDLVNQAIENCRQHFYSGERTESEHEQQQTSSEGPILEEFIPLKKCSSSEEDEEKSDDSPVRSNEKADWLRSVQLWNQNSDSISQQQEETPQIKENGGAFLPFQKAKKVAETGTTNVTVTATSPVPTASTSSTADNNHKRKEDLNRKTRRCWSPELHRRFLQSLQQLGGSHAATPKQIRELMKVDGLTNDEVKSHLQKYRLHTRRPGPSMHNNNNSQPTQFVLVGGIWVPPQNYTLAATKGDPAHPERLYVPVATPHQHQLSTGSSHSERKSSRRPEHSMGDDNARCSGSPTATSSSTETTTASPKF